MRLTIYNEQGTVQQVFVQSKRFTIGRGADNDLVIDDPGLSRRHALIETFDGIAQISDCGSQNGTYLNRRPVTGVTVLKDGDAILLGDTCDIRVQIDQSNSAIPRELPNPEPRSDEGQGHKKSTTSSFKITQPPRLGWLTTPVIALLSVGAILVIASLMIYMVKRGGQRPSFRESNTIGNDQRPSVQAKSESPTPPDQTLDNQIGEAARQLMRQISGDEQPYFLPTKALEEVKRKVKQYQASSTLPGALKSIKQRDAKIIEMARHENIEPGLVIYTALAESNGGQTGTDVIAIAGLALPRLFEIKKLMGTEHAETSLMVVAAYKIGPAVRKTHALIRIREKLITNESTQNNIWYIHEKHGISEPVYDFVVSFLALGIIAQDPRQFQVDAEPLRF